MNNSVVRTIILLFALLFMLSGYVLSHERPQPFMGIVLFVAGGSLYMMQVIIEGNAKTK